MSKSKSIERLTTVKANLSGDLPDIADCTGKRNLMKRITKYITGELGLPAQAVGNGIMAGGNVVGMLGVIRTMPLQVLYHKDVENHGSHCHISSDEALATLYNFTFRKLDPVTKAWVERAALATPFEQTPYGKSTSARLTKEMDFETYPKTPVKLKSRNSLSAALEEASPSLGGTITQTPEWYAEHLTQRATAPVPVADFNENSMKHIIDQNAMAAAKVEMTRRYSKYIETYKPILEASGIPYNDATLRMLNALPLMAFVEFDRHLTDQQKLRDVVMIMVDNWKYSGVPIAGLVQEQISDARICDAVARLIKSGDIPGQYNVLEAAYSLISVGALTIAALIHYFVGSNSNTLASLKTGSEKLSFLDEDGELCFKDLRALVSLLARAAQEEVEVNATEVVSGLVRAMGGAMDKRFDYRHVKWGEHCIETMAAFSVHEQMRYTIEEVDAMCAQLSDIGDTHVVYQTIRFTAKNMGNTASADVMLVEALPNGVDPSRGIYSVAEVGQTAHPCPGCKQPVGSRESFCIACGVRTPEWSYVCEVCGLCSSRCGANGEVKAQVWCRNTWCGCTGKTTHPPNKAPAFTAKEQAVFVRAIKFRNHKMNANTPTLEK